MTDRLLLAIYVKDYSELGATKEIAEIKYNQEEDEVFTETK